MKNELKINILKLRNDGKTYNEIKNDLKCSKSTISYYCKTYSNKKVELNESDIKKFFNETNSVQTLIKFNISRNRLAKIVGETKKIICQHCNKEIEVPLFETKKYCSGECKKEYRRIYLKDKNYNYDKLILWRKNKKMKAIEYKGGSCSLCGYNKCYSALEFHHLNPTKKDFSISNIDWSFEKVKKELDKCILVCSNCHREIHEKNVGVDELD